MKTSIYSARAVITVCASGLVLGACASMTLNTKSETNTVLEKTPSSQMATTKWASVPDISAIAPVSANSYLVVHDTKVHHPERPRIGLININREDEKLDYVELTFPKGADPLTSDLEGLCRVPGRPNEFMVNESGYWEGRFGRVFHIKLEDEALSLLGTVQLPKDINQVEGLACTSSENTGSGNKFTVILGERGGSKDHPNGAIRTGIYDLTNEGVVWNTYRMNVKAPNPWKSDRLRSITGLSIDNDGMVWASAAIDLDQDLGPFRSLVYTLGKLNGGTTNPITQISPRKVWIMDGIKIESVTTGLGRASLSYGSEDEKLGGIWRELPKEPTLILP